MGKGSRANRKKRRAEGRTQKPKTKKPLSYEEAVAIASELGGGDLPENVKFWETGIR